MNTDVIASVWARGADLGPDASGGRNGERGERLRGDWDRESRSTDIGDLPPTCKSWGEGMLGKVSRRFPLYLPYCERSQWHNEMMNVRVLTNRDRMTWTTDLSSSRKLVSSSVLEEKKPIFAAAATESERSERTVRDVETLQVESGARGSPFSVNDTMTLQ